MCTKYDFDHKTSTTVCIVHRHSLKDLCNILLAVYEAKIKLLRTSRYRKSVSHLQNMQCSTFSSTHPQTTLTHPRTTHSPTDHTPTHPRTTHSPTHPRTTHSSTHGPPTHLPQLFLSVPCQRQFPGERPLIDREESGLAGEVSHLPPALIGVRGEDILEGLHRQWRHRAVQYTTSHSTDTVPTVYMYMYIYRAVKLRYRVYILSTEKNFSHAAKHRRVDNTLCFPWYTVKNLESGTEPRTSCM